MRLALIAGAALLAAGIASRPASAAPSINGDYIEARSCNVFAGACHAEGEFTTGGRQAVLAWKVGEGSYEGVSLNGVTAVALVTADRNLGAADVQRKAVIYVDSSASSEQREAMAKLLRARAGSSLGEVVAVKAAPISFDGSGELYRVSAPGVATLRVKKEPGQLCCIQKYEVWYQPFVALKDGKIGYAVQTGFKDATLDVSWSGTAQNNAYFGHFSF